MKQIRLLFFSLSLLFVGACIDEAECTYKTVREVKFAFIDSEMHYADTLQIDTIIVEGALDTVFYGANSNRIDLTIPLSPIDTQTSIFFDLVDGLDFNIVLGYETVPRVISAECGVEMEIRGLYVVSHDVDSVIVVNNVFLKDVETNVKVYR